MAVVQPFRHLWRRDRLPPPSPLPPPGPLPSQLPACSVLEAVAEPADGDWTRELLQRIDATVRVVALPVVQWGTGIVIDVKAVRDKLKSTQHAASS